MVMFNEQACIARLESADTEELAQMIMLPTAEEEKVLRIYLGNERFRRLRNLALRRAMMRNERGGELHCNVVVIPGVLGSELTSFDRQGHSERIWLSSRHIIAGHLERLQLKSDGLTELDPRYTIRATGIMKRYYGELLLSLAEHFKVHAFWYDWRKDLRLAASGLQAQINSWFPEKEPVHIVAHSVGGLVARLYIKHYPERWVHGGSLLMLGTPNYGLYTAPQAITGDLEILQWMDALDARHDRIDFRTILKSFPSLYQLLPSPFHLPEVKGLYDADTYGTALNVPRAHLENAKRLHESLQSTTIDLERMVYIGGDGQRTYTDLAVNELKHAQSNDPYANINKVYKICRDGDGTVPHKLGVLHTTAANGGRQQIPAFCVEALHGDLTSHPKVLMALNEMIKQVHTGKKLNSKTFLHSIGQLSGLRQLDLTTCKDEAVSPDLSKVRVISENNRLESLVRRINIRSGEPVERQYTSTEERELEDTLTSGFLRGRNQSNATRQRMQITPPKIKINAILGDITSPHLIVEQVKLPVDVLAVGHYSGGKPEGVLKKIDIALSKPRISSNAQASAQWSPTDLAISDEDDNTLLLTQFTQRGILRGDLAQPLFLNDPRQPERLLVIMGMGLPGRFSEPELTLLARELCWSLGRLGKRHLATVLIGTGRDNLSVTDAVKGWVRGIKLAITGIDGNENQNLNGAPVVQSLSEITFFMKDPRKLKEFDKALSNERDRLGHQQRIIIDYQTKDKTDLVQLDQATTHYLTEQLQIEQLRRQAWAAAPEAKELTPTRITVAIEGNKYRFGAVGDGASVPEREIPLDPILVRSANDELAAEDDPERQHQLGQFLTRLLIPEDLRSQFTSTAPLVMMLDSTTARIHWELMAQTDIGFASNADPNDLLRLFLGTSRGITRQLRTTFALPPDPPPPPNRWLRVLVVADPAEDAHLAGAEEEGIAVADLFERFNTVYANHNNYIEVVRLFGPREATRTAVLQQLMMRTYDVLHFAGHCIYDPKEPAASGWIFSNGERLSAYEFTRIDRSPSFVFSNACESGITPARSNERSVDLAPSFAEAFFARGVSNFVCTAWPVEDRAARDFALTLYARLLGMTLANEKKRQDPTEALFTTDSRVNINRYIQDERGPLAMCKAMQEARIAIAEPPHDIRTWGAYQHYGNPYFRLFDPTFLRRKRFIEKQKTAVESEVAEPATNGVSDATVAHNGSDALRHKKRSAAPVQPATKSSV
jgi:pimeloyl-ACP methyl ester carboxylesterase